MNDFHLHAQSWQGRHDADVTIAFQASPDRPEKQLAELLVLELAIQETIGRVRGRLQRAIKTQGAVDG